MFKFLKEKIKGAVRSFSQKAEEQESSPQKQEVPEQEQKSAKFPWRKAKKAEKKSPEKREAPASKETEEFVELPEEEKQAKPKEAKPAKAAAKKEQEKEKISEDREEFPEEKIPEEKPLEEKVPEKGFFGKIKEKFTTASISEVQCDELLWNLEVALLENNVAVEVIDKINSDLKREIVGSRMPRGKVEAHILERLKKSVSELFISGNPLKKDKKPLVIAVFGVNGVGKTTSIAKIAYYYKQQGKEVVLAAADTFRAAAIQQLEEHANRLGVKIIKSDYGADAAAVAFDAVRHAESKGKDVVIIDTAGRLHSNANLMDELKKIMRVVKPDVNLFVGESITGNDCVEQARLFDDAVGIDGIILTKSDTDEKGGAALSVSYVTKKPIIFLGTGQEYDDLEKFDREKIIGKMGL